jgi:hypothetical protein
LAGGPQLNRAPLTQEQLQVYGDFISPFASKAKLKFLSNKTFPLDLSSLGKDAPCLRNLDLESGEESGKTFHLLGPDVIRGYSIQLVDSQEESAILKQRDEYVAAHGTDSMMDASGMQKDLGVLVLSEIAFDKNHHFAVLRYVFLSGSRTNSGATLVLEKAGARWTETTRRPCSFSMNQENPRQ